MSRKRPPLRQPSLPRSTSTGIFRREGEYWTILYAGSTVRLRDTVGLHYLAHLLGHPGRRFGADHLVALMSGQDGPNRERARSAVSKRIRAAIAGIARHHRRLGFHLSNSVKTGYTCVYVQDPDGGTVWTVGGADTAEDVLPSAVRRSPAQRGYGPQRPLSQRELEILTLLAEGASLKEAAAHLDLSYRTVETYIHRVKERERQPRLHALLVQLVRTGKL